MVSIETYSSNIDIATYPAVIEHQMVTTFLIS